MNPLYFLIKSTLLIAAFCQVAATGISAQTIHFAAHPGEGGKTTTSACVLVDEKGTIATVVELQSDPAKAVLHIGEKKIPLTYITNNNESRVAIYSLPEDSRDVLKEVAGIAPSHGLRPAQPVYASSTDRKESSAVVGRVYRFQGKVLPLAVLRVNHLGKAPAAGSGIYNADGKLVAIVRQAVYNSPTSSYCLPAEVITHIIADHTRNGRTSRCWIGIIMDELVAPPIVESVRPDSPAEKAGLKSGDVILSIGEQPVKEYAQVVDAFFYLIAGEAKKFRVLRGTKVMEFDVTPEVSPGR